jgi:transcription elongation factor Elf1
MENIKCPKCGSEQITANKKGFSGKKALVGGFLTGGVGLLAGTLGSNKVVITCLNCGNNFSPGDKKVNRPIKPYSNSTIVPYPVKTIVSDPVKDAKIIEFAKRDGKLSAVKFCKLCYEVDLGTANLYVDKITKGLDLPKPKHNKGCSTAAYVILGIIAFFIIFVVIAINTGNQDKTKTDDKITAVTVSMPEPEKVNFNTFEEWNLANGKGKLIVIEANQTNIETLKKIGIRLNYDSKDDLFATVLVFNSKKAAGMYHSLSSLSDKENAYYDKHLVAVYGKNKNTGFNTFHITVHGLEGETVEVKY